MDWGRKEKRPGGGYGGAAGGGEVGFGVVVSCAAATEILVGAWVHGKGGMNEGNERVREVAWLRSGILTVGLRRVEGEGRWGRSDGVMYPG